MARAAPQARQVVARLRLLGALGVLAPGAAWAGPWPAPEGGQTIAAAGLGGDDAGDWGEAQVFFEANARAPTYAWTGKAWGRRRESGARAFEGELALKRTFSPARSWVGAVQAGLAAQDGEDAPARLGPSVRVSAGWSPQGRSSGPAPYVALEAGGRLFDETSSVQVQLGAGAWVRPRALVFATYLFDSEADVFASHRLEAATVWFFTPRLGVQLGGRLSLDGEESAVLIGLWRRGAVRPAAH